VLEARVDRLEAALQRLADAQAQLTATVAELARRLDQLSAAVAELARRLDQLTARVDRLDQRVSWLMGDALERRYRERAHAYFMGLLARLEVVTGDELARLAHDAQRRGILSGPEHQDLLHADVVARGRRRDQETDAYLLAEVSVVIDKGDVERAARRAALCERVVGAPVLAVVAGEQILPDAEREATLAGVWRVLDGRAVSPGGSP